MQVGPDNTVIYCKVCEIKPALMSCSCVTPSLKLCSDCVPVHFRTVGSHDIGMFNPVKPNSNRSNTQCVICQKTEAAHICACKNQPTPLCLNCTEKHTSRESLEDHTLISVKAFPYFTGPEYLPALKARQDGVRAGRAKLMETLDQMTAAQKEVMNHFEGLVTEIRKLQQEKLQELRKMKEQFQALVDSALTDVGEHIYESNYQTDNWLSSALWNYSNRAEDFHYFTCTSADVDLQDIRKSVCVLLTLPVKESRRDIWLSLPTENKLMRWDCRLKNFIAPVHLSAPIRVDDGSVYSETSDGKVFVCGSRHGSADAYLINVVDGVVTQLPPMTIPRTLYGLILFSNEACVFGGYHCGKLSTCELYSMTDNRWSKLPMLAAPRMMFTPCRLDDRVFIAGGFGDSRVECFNWVARTFTPLQVRIPSHNPSISFLYNGELIVLQKNQYYRWKVDSNDDVEVTSTKEMDDSWRSSALIFQEFAYMIHLGGVIELKLPEVTIHKIYPLH